ncbi:PEX5-related protein-like, partial [Etheostoma cragini]|uniref:PEX5-related protein-like n=1 Tax=Etheostoma cragini TaxID=417921 RepID=UPI00155F2549
MVLKELPGKKSTSEGNALFTVTTKVSMTTSLMLLLSLATALTPAAARRPITNTTQYYTQESRPLLSPSIDDFLSESRSDSSSRPPTSNTAVLSTALDLVDLSDPGGCRGNTEQTRSPVRRKGGSRSPRRRTRPEETELIQVEAQQLPASPISLDSVSLPSPLDKWDEVMLDVEDAGGRTRDDKRCTSHHSSSELLWSAEFKTKNSFNVHSFDDLDFIPSSQ